MVDKLTMKYKLYEGFLKANCPISSSQFAHLKMSRLLSNAMDKINVPKKVKIIKKIRFVLNCRAEDFNSKKASEMKSPKPIRKISSGKR